MRRLLCFLTLASVPAAHATPRPLALAMTPKRVEVSGKRKTTRTDPAVTRRLFTPLRRCAARRVWPGFDPKPAVTPPSKRRVSIAPMSPWAGGSGVKVKFPI